MSTVCAWCDRVLSEDDEPLVTHDICPNCAGDLRFIPESFDRFLNGLPAPVVVVDGEGRVIAANKSAGLLLRVEPWDMAAGKLCGEVLSCVHAQLPGGCGRTVHCSGCAIRHAFEHTAATGEPVRDAHAFAHRRTPDAVVDQAYLVSTERLGPLVLVQMEEAPSDDEVLSRPPA